MLIQHWKISQLTKMIFSQKKQKIFLELILELIFLYIFALTIQSEL